MKKIKVIVATLLAAAFAGAPLAGLAADTKPAPKAKPYPLKTCVVSDEKLGEHGAPYVFVHEGQEIKMCCKGCLKDFKKNTAKYMKKLELAAKKSQEPVAPHVHQ